MKAEIETASDLGGSKGYKVERIHKDQGSEFKSAHPDDCGEMQVLSTTGEEGQHTDCLHYTGVNRVGTAQCVNDKFIDFSFYCVCRCITTCLPPRISKNLGCTQIFNELEQF